MSDMKSSSFVTGVLFYSMGILCSVPPIAPPTSRNAYRFLRTTHFLSGNRSCFNSTWAARR